MTFRTPISRRRSPISCRRRPSGRRPERSRSTTYWSTSAASSIPSTVMSEGSTRSKWISERMPPSPFAGRDAPLFGRRQRRARGPRLPVIVVTGFLGSGKTTVIRALIDRPEGAGTAIVVNEFGEIGIDQALLRASSDVTVLLGQGCLCCEVRSDLQETLRALFIERSRGAVPSFARVVVETSGLADPGPVLQTFASDRALGAEFHLQGLVAVVDAPGGVANLDRHPEARLAALSAAPVARAEHGRIDPGFLLAEGADLPSRAAAAEHDHAHAHSDDIDSFTLFFETPLPWPALEQALAALTALRGPDLLRVKGLVAVAGCRGPVVVHAVQHV